MTIARARLAIASNGLGIAQQLDLPPAFVGCCSSGTVDTPTLITNPQAILDTFGRGPLCEAAATFMALAGGPIVLCKATSAAAGAFTGLSGGAVPDPSTAMGADPMVCTPSGTPRDKYDVRVLVTSPGVTLDAATAVVRISIDGGVTYGAETPVPTSGAVVVPDTGITLTWTDNSNADQLYAGDIYVFGSSAPTFDAAGLATALAALAQERTTMDHEFVVVVGPVNVITFATVDTSAQSLKTMLPRWFLTEARDQSSGESVATWKGILEGASPGFLTATSDFVVVSPCYATQASRVHAATWRRPLSWLLAARLATIPVKQHPGRVKTGALAGIVTLHHDLNTDALRSLDAHRFIGAQSIQGRDGYYATDRTAAVSSSDFTQIMRLRVMCFAARVALNAATDYLNEDVLTVEGGFIDPTEADAIDASLTSIAERELVQTGYVSAISITVSRTDNVVLTGALTLTLRLRPLGYLTDITFNVSYTLGS